MGLTNYLTWGGEILSETRAGVEADYLPDPLGSTAALLNSSQVKTDTFSWWPYGEQRSHSGTSLTRVGYFGTLGYYTHGSGLGIYARNRVFDNAVSNWTTVDPLWPNQFPYGYCFGSPMVCFVPSGLQSRSTITCGSPDCPPGSNRNDYVISKCRKCYQHPTPDCVHWCDANAGGIWADGNKEPIFPGNPMVGFRPGPGGGIYPVRGPKRKEPFAP